MAELRITGEPDALQRARNALQYVHELAGALEAMPEGERMFARVDGRQAAVAGEQRWPPDAGQGPAGGQRGPADRLPALLARLQERWPPTPPPSPLASSAEADESEQVSPASALQPPASGASAPVHGADAAPGQQDLPSGVAGWDTPTGGVQPSKSGWGQAGSGPSGGAGNRPTTTAGRAVLPSQLHRRLLLLLHSNSQPTSSGLRISFWSQAKLAECLSRPERRVSVRKVQRLVADVREPGVDGRHPGVGDVGLRLGLVKVLPRRRRGAGAGGQLFAGNRYVLLVPWSVIEQLPVGKRPGGTDTTPRLRRSHRSATPQEPVSAGRTDTTTTKLAGQKPSEHPTLTHREEVSAAVSGPAGPTTPNPVGSTEPQVGSSRAAGAAVAADANVSSMPARRRPAGAPRALGYRGKRLEGSLRSFHAAVEQLEADTVPASYHAKIRAGALEDPQLAGGLAHLYQLFGPVEVLAVRRTTRKPDAHAS